jgi:hypothetical protein
LVGSYDTLWNCPGPLLVVSSTRLNETHPERQRGEIR